MSAVGDYEKWMREALLNLPAVEAAVGERVYNSFAPANCQFPYLIFQVAPLDDNRGQKSSTVQTRLFCDVQIYARLPLPGTLQTAIGALDEFIKNASGIISGDSIISLRRERPIARVVRGIKPDQQIIARGSTYKAWISAASPNL